MQSGKSDTLLHALLGILSELQCPMPGKLHGHSGVDQVAGWMETGPQAWRQIDSPRFVHDSSKYGLALMLFPFYLDTCPEPGAIGWLLRNKPDCVAECFACPRVPIELSSLLKTEEEKKKDEKKNKLLQLLAKQIETNGPSKETWEFASGFCQALAFRFRVCFWEGGREMGDANHKNVG